MVGSRIPTSKGKVEELIHQVGLIRTKRVGGKLVLILVPGVMQDQVRFVMITCQEGFMGIPDCHHQQRKALHSPTPRTEVNKEEHRCHAYAHLFSVLVWYPHCRH